MKNMNFKKTALFLLAWTAAFLGWAQSAPNIVLIYVDDMGYGDLGSYGSEIATPHIDKIGQEGIRFTNFYAASPVCTPSRFSLLTGLYPFRSKHQLTHALMPYDKNYLDTTEHTLAGYLRQKNYRTAMVGKWHLGLKDSSTRPTQYGFDLFTGALGGCIDYFNHDYGSMGPDWYVNSQPKKEKGYATDLLTDHAIAFIKKTKKEQPFFLYLAYTAPHYGKTDTSHIQPFTLSLGRASYKGFVDLNTLQVPQKYMRRVAAIKDPYRKTYAAMVAALDDNIGRLLQVLKKQGLLENTMLWFISDNGGYSQSYHAHASNGPLRGEKGSLYEGGIRVPAMVMWKGQIKPAQVADAVVCNVDILPTLCSIAGGADLLPAAHLDGMDLRPVLFARQSPGRALLWKFGGQTAVRQGQWKLVNGKELFNLDADLSETKNLATQYPEKVKQLTRLQHELASPR